MKQAYILRLKQNLQTLLKDHALTASELAKVTGIAKQVLSDWLAGAKPKNIEQVAKVAEALGVSIEALCFEEDKVLLFNSRSPKPTFLERSGDTLKGKFELFLRRLED